MRRKLLKRVVHGQPGVVAAVVAVALGCQHEPGRAIVVEADSTAAISALADTVAAVSPMPPAPIEEVVIIERPASPGEPEEREPEPGDISEVPHDTQAGEPDTVATTTEETTKPATVDPTLPAGTYLELELKTPLHTATTLVGDRFAARLIDDVQLGETVVLPAHTLVEGRVSRVVRAEDGDDEQPAMVELEFRSLILPSGERRPLKAELADPDDDGLEADLDDAPGGDRVAGAASGALTGALLGQVLGGGSRSVIVGTILGGVAGATLVAPTPDREVIVPSGTPLTVVLSVPIRLTLPETSERSAEP
ncbi:MAG: glycine zipper family protein [Gemmatimonadetes bacterium]|nr:glycine zipper family protein [Gemmatimonadota bacterium]